MAATLPLTAAASAAATAPTELFFSEYVEGSGYNKAVEIYNGTGQDVSLNGYSVRLHTNGAVVPSQTVDLSGVVPADDVFVVANSRAAQDLLDEADLTNNAVANWNGDDAVVLAKDGALVDVIGQIGVDPGDQWGTDAESTEDNTLRRKEGVVAGDPDGSDYFDPALEWDGFPKDTLDGFGWHLDAPPSVDSSFPWDGRINVGSTQTLSLTFNEPVTLEADAVTLACDGSEVPVTVVGQDAEYTVDPSADLAPAAVCTWSVAGSGVTDLDGRIRAMRADFVVEFTVAEAGEPCSWNTTPTYAIQGTGSGTSLRHDLNTTGVVVGDYEHKDGLRGFYIQDLHGDDDADTSDGLFVFNGHDDDVSVGDVVVVGGTPSEFQGQTQVSAYRDGVTVCGTGSVSPTDVTLPMTNAEREDVEGMLVRLPQTLAVTETYQLGRFGQVTMSAAHEMTPASLGGRLPQPTNLVEPGPASVALQAENDRHSILFDDATNGQNPDPIVFSRDETALTAGVTLRGGDTATGTVGVLTYTWAGNSASGNAYRVRPIGTLGGHVDFDARNERPAAPEDVDGGLTAASFNVLNYFNTLDTSWAEECQGGVAGPVVDCRGANDALELERQADKIVAALTGLDADVVGLVEIENDGYGDDSALADLTRRLNAEVGEGTYRYLDVDERSGQVDALGDDAIKVAMIYKPGEVVPNGETAVLNTESFVNGGGELPRNRPALAQAFVDRDTGGRFTMVVNHLKSKGSGCGAGDDDTKTGQGSCNGTRVRAAEELAAWLATYPTGIKEPDILVMGDLNAYAQEDPVDALRDAGYTDLVQEYEGPGAYSYVYDGQWGYLDHALASPSLASQVSGTTTWHINADEPPVLDYNTEYKSQEQVDGLYAPDPYRSSDHDPVLVGLDLRP